MSDDIIRNLLNDDFSISREALERDGFSERILERLGAHRKARLAVIGATGAAGAVIAGAQFVKISGLFAPFGPMVSNLAANTKVAGFAGAIAPQLLAAAAIAVAFALTAIILQGER